MEGFKRKRKKRPFLLGFVLIILLSDFLWIGWIGCCPLLDLSLSLEEWIEHGWL